MKRALELHLSLTADAGYGSEENYTLLEEKRVAAKDGLYRYQDQKNSHPFYAGNPAVSGYKLPKMSVEWCLP